MPISFSCRCGRILRVADELAGRKARCPGCSSVLTVPRSNIEEYNPTDVSITATLIQARKEPDELEEPATAAVTDRSLNRAPVPAKKRRLASKRARKKEHRQLPMVFINKEVAAGVVMIIAAIVWFVGALVWFHTLFFYPPVLLILGIAAIYKGFTAPD